MMKESESSLFSDEQLPSSSGELFCFSYHDLLKDLWELVSNVLFWIVFSCYSYDWPVNWNLCVTSTDQFLTSFQEVCLDFGSTISRSFDKYLLWYWLDLWILEVLNETLGEAFLGNTGKARDIFLKWSIRFEFPSFIWGYALFSSEGLNLFVNIF